jgi:hypothetical protein
LYQLPELVLLSPIYFSFHPALWGEFHTLISVVVVVGDSGFLVFLHPSSTFSSFICLYQCLFFLFLSLAFYIPISLLSYLSFYLIFVSFSIIASIDWYLTFYSAYHLQHIQTFCLLRRFQLQAYL